MSDKGLCRFCGSNFTHNAIMNNKARAGAMGISRRMQAAGQRQANVLPIQLVPDHDHPDYVHDTDVPFLVCRNDDVMMHYNHSQLQFLDQKVCGVGVQ